MALCVKALIGERGCKRQCRIVLLISTNTSAADATKGKAVKPSWAIISVARWEAIALPLASRPKMQHDDNTTFLAHLRPFFALE